MIPLSIQISTLLFSFFFGIVFSFFTFLQYYLFHKKNKYIRFFVTVIFIFSSVWIYFVGLKTIDEAIIHIYFLLSVFLGILVETSIHKRIEKIFKKWYTHCKNRKWKNEKRTKK